MTDDDIVQIVLFSKAAQNSQIMEFQYQSSKFMPAFHQKYTQYLRHEWNTNCDFFIWKILIRVLWIFMLIGFCSFAAHTSEHLLNSIILEVFRFIKHILQLCSLQSHHISHKSQSFNRCHFSIKSYGKCFNGQINKSEPSSGYKSPSVQQKA